MPGLCLGLHKDGSPLCNRNKWKGKPCKHVAKLLALAGEMPRCAELDEMFSESTDDLRNSDPTFLQSWTIYYLLGLSRVMNHWIYFYSMEKHTGHIQDKLECNNYIWEDCTWHWLRFLILEMNTVLLGSTFSLLVEFWIASFRQLALVLLK